MKSGRLMRNKHVGALVVERKAAGTEKPVGLLTDRKRELDSRGPL